MDANQLWWTRLCWLIFFCGLLADNWVTASLAAEPEVKFNLLSLPGSRQADKRLAMPARLNYEHAPLRMCLAQMSERFQFTYWIDRRVDADRLINLSVSDSTLRECLAKLAQLCDAEIGLVENVVTIAHPQQLANMQYAAVRLHNQLTIIQVADAQSDTSKSKNASDAVLRPLTWPKLTTPLELAELINKNWNIQLTCELPHDLMNSGQLQPCTLATQLTLLYGGFDRCAAGKRPGELRILPLPAAGPWQSIYSSGEVPAINVEAVVNQFPDARLQRSGNQWTLVGSTAAHAQLLQSPLPINGQANGRPPRGPRSRSNPTSDSDALATQRYDISKQENKPLGAVLKNLGDQLGLKVHWDNGLPPSAPQTPVTIEANKSTLDEILAQLGTQAKLSIIRSDTDVHITRP